jgi:Predicted esterase of the alpha/beta hydrolase fold
MKKAALFHGTDGTPHDHWFPWLSAELKQYGYQVFAPELPENHTPNRDIYEAFLKKSGWDFADNVLFGHSSGTTTILNLLMANWFPNIKAAVLVGTFLNEKLTAAADWYEPGQFDGLFVQEFDTEKIKSKCPKFIFVHGDNDYACDYNDAKDFCSKLGGSFITIQNGRHLSSSSGITELPQIINEMKKLELL